MVTKYPDPKDPQWRSIRVRLEGVTPLIVHNSEATVREIKCVQYDVRKKKES